MRGKTRLLGIAITLLCLGLAFYGVDYRALWGALATANYVLVLPAVLLWLFGYVARTVRWRTILAGAGAGPIFDLFGVLMIGFATNNLLPARLGELARAYLLRRRTGLRKTFVLASVFLERVFDGLALVALILLLSLLVKPPEWDREADIAANVRLIELIATVTFVGVALAIAVLLLRHELAMRTFAFVARALPARLNRFATGAFAAFVNGLSSMRRPGVVLGTAVLSVAVWAIEWSAYVVIASAFDLGLPTPQLAAACALLLVVVNLGIMLPAAPGYVGTFQFFAVSALAVWGVPREQALAVAIVAHLAQYVLVTGIGLAFFGREHMSLRAMAAATREPSDANADAAADTTPNARAWRRRRRERGALLKARSLLGAAFGLILFAVFLWSQDLQQLAAALSTVEPGWILPAVAIYFAGVWLRAMRWRLLMSPFADVPTERLFRVILIGFAINNVLPLRLGELARTFLLRQSHGVPIASSLATVLIERLLDVFALCGIMTLVLLWAPLGGIVLAVAGTAATVTAAGIAGLLTVLMVPRALLERQFSFSVGIAGRVHPKLGSLASSIVDGLRVLEEPRALLAIVPLSILCWVAELGLYYFLALSLDVQAGPLGLAAGMVIANLVTVLPSPPGYVGTFDFFLLRTLTDSFGVPEARAGAFTLLAHAVLLVPVVVVGLVLLSWEDLSFKGLARGRVERREGETDDSIVTPAPAQQGTDS